MMNNDTPQTGIPAEKEKDLSFKKTLQKFWKRVTHQWGWKLTSVVLAICLWGGLISQDTTLPRTKTFSDVKITVTNASVLRQNGLIVVSGLEELPLVKITAQLPQSNYSAATADRYTVRADLTQVKGTGEQTILLTASTSNAAQYGTVIDISIPQITVQVEEYVTRTRVPVHLKSTGDVPEGFYATTALCDPLTVDISGPRSVVESIAKCVVQYDTAFLEPVQGTARTSAPFILLDRSGNEVDTANLTVSSQSITLRDVIVEQTLYPTLEVPISTENLVYGTPAEGYQVTGVTVVPSSVVIAARDLTPYQKEGTYFYLLGRVNVNGESQSKTETITISSRGVEHMSEETAYVTVEIQPIPQTEQTT